jgi:hypothetical protein
LCTTTKEAFRLLAFNLEFENLQELKFKKMPDLKLRLYIEMWNILLENVLKHLKEV